MVSCVEPSYTARIRVPDSRVVRVSDVVGGMERVMRGGDSCRAGETRMQFDGSMALGRGLLELWV